MSLPAQNPKQQIVSAGGQTVFAFTFRCDDSTTVQVWSNDAQVGGPAIALNADQVANPGGIVTIAAQLAGVIVTVERVSPKTQGLALTAYNPFPALSISAGLDKIVELLQEFWAQLIISFHAPRSQIAKISSFEFPAPQLGALIGWVDGGGGLFKLGNVTGFAGGEQLVDSGDHVHFTSLFPPVGTGALYRNGQRNFSPDDYTVAGNVWTMVIALGAGEKLNADYTH